MCQSCGKIREVAETGELPLTYQTRRPTCPKCGYKKRIETLGGHGPTWRGGARYLDHKGYVITWDQESGGYRREHQLIWEKYNGPLPKGYIVHHKDGNRQNNNLYNLEAMPKLAHDKMNKSLIKNHFNRTTGATEDLCQRV